LADTLVVARELLRRSEGEEKDCARGVAGWHPAFAKA
jgi:hypothetical protein